MEALITLTTLFVLRLVIPFGLLLVAGALAQRAEMGRREF